MLQERPPDFEPSLVNPQHHFKANRNDSNCIGASATRDKFSPLELQVSLVIPWWILLSRRRMLSEKSLRSDGSSSSKIPTLRCWAMHSSQQH